MYGGMCEGYFLFNFSPKKKYANKNVFKYSFLQQMQRLFYHPKFTLPPYPVKKFYNFLDPKYETHNLWDQEKNRAHMLQISLKLQIFDIVAGIEFSKGHRSHDLPIFGNGLAEGTLQNCICSNQATSAFVPFQTNHKQIQSVLQEIFLFGLGAL